MWPAKMACETPPVLVRLLARIVSAFSKRRRTIAPMIGSANAIPVKTQTAIQSSPLRVELLNCIDSKTTQTTMRIAIGVATHIKSPINLSRDSNDEISVEFNFVPRHRKSPGPIARLRPREA